MKDGLLPIAGEKSGLKRFGSQARLPPPFQTYNIKVGIGD
jgi:hypothetical protein